MDRCNCSRRWCILGAGNDGCATPWPSDSVWRRLRGPPWGCAPSPFRWQVATRPTHHSVILNSRVIRRRQRNSRDFLERRVSNTKFRHRESIGDVKQSTVHLSIYQIKRWKFNIGYFWFRNRPNATRVSCYIRTYTYMCMFEYAYDIFQMESEELWELITCDENFYLWYYEYKSYYVHVCMYSISETFVRILECVYH